MLILRGHKFSLQNALDKVFGALGRLRLVPTASAYCQARQKIDPALFQELTASTAEDFYRYAEEEGSVVSRPLPTTELRRGPRIFCLQAKRTDY
jgi:hypothetical protein